MIGRMLRTLAVALAVGALTSASLAAQQLELFFDGQPGPFVPERVGQKAVLEARLLGMIIPLRLCKVRFPGDWAKVTLDSQGLRGTIEVLSLKKAAETLAKVPYEISVELLAKGGSKTHLFPQLSLDPTFVMYRLHATVRTPSGAVQEFPLLTNRELQPLQKSDVIVWPPAPLTRVEFRGNDVWVGMRAEPTELQANVAEVRARPLLAAVRLRRKTGETKWLYVNLAPAALYYDGWKDEGSHFRLPRFAGSEAFYEKIRNHFKSRGVPFEKIGR